VSSISNASGNLSMGSGSSRGSLFGSFPGRRNNNLKSSSSHSLSNSATGGGCDNDGELSASAGATASNPMARPRRNRSRYVVKQLSPELQHGDKINFLKGTVDLAMETRFLASLDHENVISLHGVSSKGAFSEGYFIVLEKVTETLGKRVKTWMDMDRRCKGITGVFTGSKKKLLRLDSERISASHDLAVGMQYLHDRKIVFRDLVSSLPIVLCALNDE
jgi:serine/threonine protein kinase